MLTKKIDQPWKKNDAIKNIYVGDSDICMSGRKFPIKGKGR